MSGAGQPEHERNVKISKLKRRRSVVIASFVIAVAIVWITMGFTMEETGFLTVGNAIIGVVITIGYGIFTAGYSMSIAKKIRAVSS